jgi:glycosyltransferase involved in cell wall biosynthesis
MREIKKVALLAVGDDAWQGGIQYITNIMNGLNAVADESPVELHLFRHSAQNFPDLPKFTNVRIEVQNTETVFQPWSVSNRVTWLLQRKLMNRINPRMENCFLEQGFDFVFPATLSDCNKRLNVASWIADFQYHHFPDGANAAVVADARATITRIAENAGKVVLSSKFCEKDCLSLFPVTAGKTHVMPFAVFLDKAIFDFKDFKSVRDKYELPERYIMVANLFAPTKNHKTLFHALGILKSRGIRVDVVCTGNIVDYRNQAFANEILQMLTTYKIRNQVHFLGLVPRADQVAMYRMAVALVQPSVNEGWSTSVEEAKALGKQIILSDIDVHIEQAPAYGHYFDRLNAEDMAGKIAHVWKEQENTPFPDAGIEKTAYDNYQQQVRSFGRRFLEIARY